MRQTVVRCPQCGSTDAGEIDGMLEFTRMRCNSCGHEDLCDDYQIKDDWNVTIDLEPGADLPRWVELPK
jgi:hypothetical protein